MRSPLAPAAGLIPRQPWVEGLSVCAQRTNVFIDAVLEAITTIRNTIRGEARISMLDPQFSSDYCSLSPSVSLYTIYGIYTHLLQGEEATKQPNRTISRSTDDTRGNPCSCWGTSLSPSPVPTGSESVTTISLVLKWISKPRLFDQGDGAFNIQKEVLAL